MIVRKRLTRHLFGRISVVAPKTLVVLATDERRFTTGVCIEDW